MAVGWSLPAGMRHFAPWLYSIYIIGMSLYKAHYFDRTLRATFTRDAYDDYTASVPYTLVPLVY